MTTGNANGLIVPIRVEALLIGSGDATNTSFSSADADFSLLKDQNAAYLGQTVVLAPFSSVGSFSTGVHLHWNLPRALRSGTIDANGNLQNTPVPNRWLVTRVSQMNETSVKYKSWVIESDYLSATLNTSQVRATTVPDGTSYKYMGWAYTLEDWLSRGNSGSYFDNLTSLGYGVPNFASYYLNCRTVFGFYDASPTEDNGGNGQVDYVVVGWYQDSSKDPAVATPLTGANNPLGWNFSGSSNPNYSVYHGAICGIQYDINRTYLTSSNAPLTPTIALGNNPVEALSAMISTNAGDASRARPVESLLNSLQFGLLKKLDQPGGLSQVDTELFEQTFAAIDAGVRWDVRPTEKAGIEALRTDLSPDISGEVAANLAKLNTLQGELDMARANAMALQAQIYLDWTRFVYLEHNGSSPLWTTYPHLQNNLYNYLAYDSIPACNAAADRVNLLQQRIDNVTAEIQAALPSTLVVESNVASRFHGPTDPAIVLVGDGIVAAPPDNVKSIQCVLESNSTTTIVFPAGVVTGSAATSLAASALPADPSWSSLPYAILGELVQRTVLVDPHMSAVVTATLASQGGNGNPAVMDSNATTSALNAAQSCFLSGQSIANGISFAGQMPQPSIALRSWSEQPWNPLILEWQFHLDPLVAGNNGYPPTLVVDRFTLENGKLDYSLPSGTAFSGVVQTYKGRTMLSGRATNSLVSQLEQYLQHFPDSELSSIVEQLETQPMVTQALAGFNDALCMIAPIMQLPVSDPNSNSAVYKNWATTTVSAAVGDQNTHSALANNAYNPIRAGWLSLAKLNLVDEFGQSRSVALSNTIVSTAIPTLPLQAAGSPPQMVPPLRLAQHSQLLFDWVAANDVTSVSSSLPGGNPICGWVVPNHLDASLALYTAEGGALGTLAPNSTGNVIWQSAPGVGTPGMSLDDSLAGANAVLAGFARNVVSGGGAYLSSFIQTLDRVQSTRSPARYTEHTGTAVLLGAPLALIQARIDMQLLGRPAPDQSWAALNDDVTQKGTDLLRRTTHGYTQVQFPVVLGQTSRIDDGLLGYFLQSCDSSTKRWSTNYSTFYSEGADGSTGGIVPPAYGSIRLTLDRENPPMLVTMLVDPRSPVFAQNGVSPVQSLTVPPVHASYALSRMVFTFLASPLITLPSSLPMLLPAEANGDWSFIGYGGNAWRKIKPEQLNTNATLQNAGKLIEGWLQLTPKARKAHDG